jgi:hypothetical protein
LWEYFPGTGPYLHECHKKEKRKKEKKATDKLHRSIKIIP